jgi:hypothetical protein
MREAQQSQRGNLFYERSFEAPTTKMQNGSLCSESLVGRLSPMSDDASAAYRKRANQKARKFFDRIWRSGDCWNLETSDFERAKYEHEIATLDGHYYKRAVDIGCGAGQLTRMLLPFVESIAVDVAPSAIARAWQTSFTVPRSLGGHS